jgi:hypothetical protein
VRRLIQGLIAAGDRFTAWGERLLGRRGLRLAWLVVASLVAVPMLALGVVEVASAVAHEERTEQVEVDAAGLDGIVVDNGAGRVDVVGVDDADAVTVHARISEGLRATGHEVTERDGRLHVDGSCPIVAADWCGVDYTIEVPVDLHVTVQAQDGVSVSDVTAGVDADSDTSSVELARLGGDVTVDVDQGRVDARDLTAERVELNADQGSVDLEFAESPREVTVDADQGRVDVVLPDEDDVFYATSTDADQGSVVNEIRDDPSSDRSITVSADQGSITVTYAS